MVEHENVEENESIVLEKKTNTVLLFVHSHFQLKISEKALDKIMDLDDLAKRAKRLLPRVVARPDAEEILYGTKQKEAGELIVAVLDYGSKMSRIE